MHKVTPFLWFDDQAEDAINYYPGSFQAMLKMDKIDVEALQRAYNQQ